MIDRFFAAAQAIRTHAHIPGRMVQIRSDTEPAIVVFALYQYVWGDSSAGEDLQRQREEVWSALHSAVRGTPWRAQLIIAGDFNTPCLPEPSLAGPGIPPVTHIRQTDQPRFQQLLTTFDLNALNTWQRRKHAHTYRFPKKDGLQQTQIDYLSWPVHASWMLRPDVRGHCALPLCAQQACITCQFWSPCRSPLGPGLRLPAALQLLPMSISCCGINRNFPCSSKTVSSSSSLHT